METGQAPEFFRGKRHMVHNNPYSTVNTAASAAQTVQVRLSDPDHHIMVRTWDGNGPPVLLIHGIGSSAASWDALIPALRQHLSPIAVDLRGHGASCSG